MGIQLNTPFGTVSIGGGKKSGGSNKPGTHKMDGQKVYDGMDSQYKDAKAVLEELKGLKEEIKNNPNMSDAEKKSALASVDRGINAAKEALDFATKGAKYDTTSGSVDGDADMAAARSAIMQAQMSANEARDDIRFVQPAASCSTTQVPEPGCTGHASGASSASNTSGASAASGTSGASGSSSASGSTGLGAMEFGGKSVDQMMEMMNSDPQALMSHLSGMDAEDKNMAMQMIQQRLQEINRMFSMMSNMQKAAHDTAKAAINNMRV